MPRRYFGKIRYDKIIGCKIVQEINSRVSNSYHAKYVIDFTTGILVKKKIFLDQFLIDLPPCYPDQNNNITFLQENAHKNVFRVVFINYHVKTMQHIAKPCQGHNFHFGIILAIRYVVSRGGHNIE